STSAAMFAAAVVWSTPTPSWARRTAGRLSSTRLTKHGDRVAAVEQHLLGGDLVGAVALRPVVVAAARRHRRLRLGDRPVEPRRGRRVRVVAVDVAFAANGTNSSASAAVKQMQ